MAIPPKKYQEPLMATREVELASWNSRRQKIVQVKGTRKPKTPRRVGLPRTVV
jgi:hypothetical protein